MGDDGKSVKFEDALGNKINKKIIGIQIAPLNEEIKSIFIKNLSFKYNENESIF